MMKMRKIPASIIVVFVLLGIVIVYMQCNRGKEQLKPVTVTQTIVDSFYRVADTVIIHDTPTLVSSKPQKVPQSLKPSGNLDSCQEQCEYLGNQLFTQNIFKKTYQSDSSSITIEDTVLQNNIYGRSVTFSIRPKIIREVTTNTTTVPMQLRRQVYLGTGVSSQGHFDNIALHAGVLYKNRKENITELNVGYNNNGQLLYGVNTYWKLSFRKK